MNGPYKGVAVILQCRLGSKRLPGKALLSLGGIPMVRYVMSVVKNIDAQYYILACDEASYETLAPLATYFALTCSITSLACDSLSKTATVLLPSFSCQ